MPYYLLGMISLVSTLAFAGTLSELDIYKRCYARMTNLAPKPNESLYRAVANGNKKGSTACIELFDQAALGNDGLLKNRNDNTARKILKTFNDLHRGWFQVKHTADPFASLVNDIEEPALFFTKTAFTANVPFSSVVTGSSGVHGVRTPIRSDYTKFKAQRIASYSASMPYANDVNLVLALFDIELNKRKTVYITTGVSPFVVDDSLLVDVGELIGVKTPSPININNYYGSFSIRNPQDGTISPDRFLAAETLYNSTTNIRAHFGGGIIGSPQFLAANMNLSVNVFPDKYEHINRRLTGRIFEDLLCHQLPSLSAADVASETNAFVRQKSPHTFQTDQTCMQCHSSIDGLGYGLNNLILSITGPVPNAVSQRVGVRMRNVLKLPSIANATEFALQPPNGRLHYRENITGIRVDVGGLRSPAEIGNSLAKQNDLYYCAAKRYYNFLTGINVDITQRPDRKDPSYALNLKHYNKVKALGDSLKKTQNVRTLLYEIFKSEAFQAWNFDSQEVK